LIIKTVIESEPWEVDENVINVPWRKIDPATKPLRFGLIRGHPKRPLHPPVARALHETATKLESQGHDMVLLDDKIPDLWTSTVLAWKYFALDPKKTPAQHVKDGGEPWVPSIATTNLEELDGWEASLDGLWEMNMERAKIVKAYHDLMIGEELDAVLMVGYQATAVPHDTYGVPIYTVLQNLLNVSLRTRFSF
jgi:amidase